MYSALSGKLTSAVILMHSVLSVKLTSWAVVLMHSVLSGKLTSADPTIIPEYGAVLYGSKGLEQPFDVVLFQLLADHAHKQLPL